MEVTGLAYEEMQEQNSRLLQQLKEKDDANFKLMSDRIKTNQLNKLFREEKQVLEEQVSLRLNFKSHKILNCFVCRSLSNAQRLTHCTHF